MIWCGSRLNATYICSAGNNQVGVMVGVMHLPSIKFRKYFNTNHHNSPGSSCLLLLFWFGLVYDSVVSVGLRNLSNPVSLHERLIAGRTVVASWLLEGILPIVAFYPHSG